MGVPIQRVTSLRAQQGRKNTLRPAEQIALFNRLVEALMIHTTVTPDLPGEVSPEVLYSFWAYLQPLANMLTQQLQVWVRSRGARILDPFALQIVGLQHGQQRAALHSIGCSGDPVLLRIWVNVGRFAPEQEVNVPNTAAQVLDATIGSGSNFQTVDYGVDGSRDESPIQQQQLQELLENKGSE